MAKHSLMAFQTQFRVHFDETDPAGIAFFAVIYSKIHRAYEAFLESMDVSLNSWFLHPEIIAPIRHIETDFYHPMVPFKDYLIQVEVSGISESTFQLQFHVKDQDTILATVKTVHTCCDKIKMTKEAIPPQLKSKLQNHLI